MRRLLPPHVFVLTALVMLAVGSLCPHVPWPWSVRLLGLPLMSVGLICAAWHARLFMRIGTTLPTFDPPVRLVSVALYAYTRNPMYLGFALALLGLLMMLGCWANLLPWAAFVLIVDRWYIAFEERVMHTQFADDYAEYCRRVRRWL